MIEILNAVPTEDLKFEGIISKFLFKTDTFAIINFKTPKGCLKALGDFYNILEGEELIIKGAWQEHPKYGRQLKVDYWEKKMPTTREAAIDFLSSGLIRGIGPVTAEKIVDALGPTAVDRILNQGPDILKSVKGIGKKATEVYRSVQETYEINRVISELRPLGLSAKLAIKAYERFGRPVTEYVKRNPYCLIKLNLVGFARADEIARKMGIAPDSDFRIQAAARHILTEALWNEGHTYLPEKEFIKRSLDILKCKTITGDMLIQAVRSLDDIKVNNDKAYLKWADACEEGIAEHVHRLNVKLSNIDPEQQINQYEKESKIKLTPEQKDAVKKSINNGFLILTGGPGVGKSQTVRAVVNVYQKLFDNPVLLAAPTGRAARRLSELTGHEASTVHRLLRIKYGGKAEYNKQNPLNAGLIVLDETSMMDIILGKKLFDAVPDGTRVLVIGDPDQLPPVGPGYLLRDLIDAGLPTVKLTKIFRQAAESQIVKNAHLVNQGKMIRIKRGKYDFLFIQRETPEEIAECILSCARRIKKDFLVLSPMKIGVVGTNELNKELQKVLNLNKGPEIKYGQNIFKEGDKVIQKRNNYEKMVFNGDIGTITNISDSSVQVKFQDGLVEYSVEELKDIELGYSITIHRSQGSECDTIIVPATTKHYIMLARNLIYTAITRGTKKVIIIGTKKALALAVKNNKMVQRYTMLKEKIQGEKVIGNYF